ncbi:MAG TPA: hypothetical protein VL651_13005 [Bacteroidia bacterium]|jgi:hypothetical protein|nr:hypothetical protein [Bacteroidia bacterium]
MRNFIRIILLLCLFSIHLHAQNTDMRAGTADQRAFMLAGGIFITDLSELNAHVSSFGNTSGFSSQWFLSGLHLIWPTATKYYEWKGMLGFDVFIPQLINAGDTAQFTLRGWHFMSSLFAKDLFRRNTKLAFEIAPGIEWGKAKLRMELPGSEFRYSNVFIAPFARMEFRYIIKRVAIGIRACYRFDLTDPLWREKTGGIYSFGKTRFAGPGVQLFIGLGRAS